MFMIVTASADLIGYGDNDRDVMRAVLDMLTYGEGASNRRDVALVYGSEVVKLEE